MSAPVLKVELGFGSTWKTADGSISWTDVTSYVMEDGVTVQRGRANEFGEFSAGTATLQLNNSDRRFDPQHSAGAYYPNVKPGVPIRITATSGVTSYAVFRGFVDAWPQSYMPANRMAFVNLSCTDGTRKLARAQVERGSPYTAALRALAPVRWYPLTFGSSSNSVTPDFGSQGVDGSYTSGVTFDSATTLDPGSDAAALFASGEVQIGAYGALPSTRWYTFILKTTASTGAIFDQGVSAGSTIDLTGGKIEVQGPVALTSTVAVNDGSPHAVAIDMNGQKIYVDGTDVTNTAIVGGVFFVSADIARIGNVFPGSAYSGGRYAGWLQHFAMHTGDIGASGAATLAAARLRHTGETADARIGRLLTQVGWPTSLRSLQTGDTTLGPQAMEENTWATIQQIERTEQGRVFLTRDGKVRLLNRYWFLTDTTATTSQATLVDDNTATPYSDIGFDYDDRLIVNKATGSRPDGNTVTVANSTSVDDYGESGESLGTLQVTTDAQVRSVLEYRVDRYKEPLYRLQSGLRVPLHRSTTIAAAVLALELGYRVTVKRTPQGVGSQYSTAQVVEGVDHEITADSWWSTLNLSPVDIRSYGVWGTSTWDDTNARWAY